MTATHALGWALVHSLWQCALAAVALAFLLAIVPAPWAGAPPLRARHRDSGLDTGVAHHDCGPGR